MIDSIIVPSSIHLTLGIFVLASNALVLLISGWLAYKRQPLNRWVSATFILFQLVLMVQVLLGIKLLDQGLGILQLYIHYLGGLAPLFFCLLFYWISPGKDLIVRNRWVLIVSALALFFTLLTFTVGRIYVADGFATEAETSSGALGAAERGGDLYITCAGCHGADGEGVDGVGVALDQSEFVRTQSDDELVAYIIAGRAADAADNRSGVAMPAWGGNPSLSEENLYDIVAFLRTLDRNESGEN